MAKKIKKYTTEMKPSKVEEPVLEYRTVKRLPVINEFDFKRFEKTAAKISFTQAEWSNILHLSERTLQRYSKENKTFEGIYVDRILHIDQLINLGLETFENADVFYRWLKRDKKVLGRIINFQSLYSTQGILDIIDEIGRIQHGVYI